MYYSIISMIVFMYNNCIIYIKVYCICIVIKNDIYVNNVYELYVFVVLYK